MSREPVKKDEILQDVIELNKIQAMITSLIEEIKES